MEKVIFRQEKNPYDPESYLAIFPEDEVCPGRIGCVPFHFHNDSPVFEPYTEISWDFYYNESKIIHKGTELSLKCLDAIQKRYDSMFTIAEKIMRR